MDGAPAARRLEAAKVFKPIIRTILFGDPVS